MMVFPRMLVRTGTKKKMPVVSNEDSALFGNFYS